MISFFRETFEYSEMLKSLVSKDLRTRYKGSILGFLWTFINPLMMLVVYSVVFPYIMRVQTKNYAMFVFVGLLPWLYFANSLQISSSIVITNSNLVKKIYFPRQILPISVGTAGLINFIYSLCIVFLSLMFIGIKINGVVFFLPAIIMIQYLMVLGFCLIFSSINVYFRDMEHILGIIINAWFYITPVLYPIDIFPKEYLKLLYLNPMTPLTLAYRDILYNGKVPDLGLLLSTFIFSILLFIVGCIFFKKLEKGFAEAI